MDWLFPFYISTTIFGVGITIIDLPGLVGHHGEQADSSGHGTDHDTGDDGGGHGDASAIGHAEAGDGGHAGGGHHGDHDFSHDTQDVVSDQHGADQQSVVVHDQSHKHKNPVIALLSLARSIVYFCLGFGPVGWFGLATGKDTYIIENFQQLIKPFAETLSLFPVNSISVITGAEGRHEPISAIHPNAIDQEKNKMIAGAISEAMKKAKKHLG